jgi:hypothetical protein
VQILRIIAVCCEFTVWLLAACIRYLISQRVLLIKLVVLRWPEVLRYFDCLGINEPKTVKSVHAITVDIMLIKLWYLVLRLLISSFLSPLLFRL